MAADGFQALVRRARNGDRAAMDEVLETIRPHLEPLARPFVDPARPAASTSDLLQESCLRAWQKLDTFRGGTNDDETFAMFRAWIGQIVRRLGRNAIRDRNGSRRSPPNKLLRLTPRRPGATTSSGRGMDLPANDPSPSAHARQGEMSQRVRAALSEVPDEIGAAIVRMYYLEGHALPEIGTRLGLEYADVRVRYRTTMRRLERILETWV